ncbi:hypothetical protein [Carbonactinospora thermoautotrophica]|uniref:hypothetical protein n=1 Tax=Carbonactinospora thermoautotrophica TaxID=1469144 RepID=UPI003DAA12A3
MAKYDKDRPRAVDLLIAAASLNGGVGIAAAQPDIPFHAFPQFAFVYVGACLLLWRRRRPGLVFALVSAVWLLSTLTTPRSQIVVPALAFAAYTLGQYAAERLWYLATGAALVYLPVLLVLGHPQRILMLDTAIVVGACFLGLTVRRRRVRWPWAGAVRAAALSRAYREQRMYLIRDLQEVFAHRTPVEETTLATVVTGRDAAWYVRAADKRRTLTELRNVLAALAAPPQARADARPSWHSRVEVLVAGVARAGMEIRYTAAPDVRDVPEPVGQVAYEVVQETLARAVEHIGRPPARVRLQRSDAGLTVSVLLDVGRRDVRPAMAALGLARRRVERAGGRFSAHIRPNGHMEVRAALPC